MSDVMIIVENGWTDSTSSASVETVVVFAPCIVIAFKDAADLVLGSERYVKLSVDCPGVVIDKTTAAAKAVQAERVFYNSTEIYRLSNK